LFSHVQDRLKLKINITPIFAAMVTRHGENIAYLHQFEILEHATSACNKEDQTIDYLINQCTLLQKQRELFRRNVLKSGNWPVRKHEPMTKHLKAFLTFTKSIDFDQL
jgi:hypothetical protein